MHSILGIYNIVIDWLDNGSYMYIDVVNASDGQGILGF